MLKDEISRENEKTVANMSRDAIAAEQQEIASMLGDLFLLMSRLAMVNSVLDADAYV